MPDLGQAPDVGLEDVGAGRRATRQARDAIVPDRQAGLVLRTGQRDAGTGNTQVGGGSGSRLQPLGQRLPGRGVVAGRPGWLAGRQDHEGAGRVARHGQQQREQRGGFPLVGQVVAQLTLGQQVFEEGLDRRAALWPGLQRDRGHCHGLGPRQPLGCVDEAQRAAVVHAADAGVAEVDVQPRGRSAISSPCPPWAAGPVPAPAGAPGPAPFATAPWACRSPARR